MALSLGSPPPDVIRRRIRMEPGLSSVFKRRPSGRLAEHGIWGQADGGQAESDLGPKARGLGTNDLPRSLKIQSNYGIVGACGRYPLPPPHVSVYGLRGTTQYVFGPHGDEGREIASYEDNSGAFAGVCRGRLRLGLRDATAAERALRRGAGRGTGALIGSAASGGSAGGALAGAAIGAGTGALIGSASTPPGGYYGGPPPGGYYGAPPPRRCAEWAYDYNGNRVCTAFY